MLSLHSVRFASQSPRPEKHFTLPKEYKHLDSKLGGAFYFFNPLAQEPPIPVGIVVRLNKDAKTKPVLFKLKEFSRRGGFATGVVGSIEALLAVLKDPKVATVEPSRNQLTYE